jgi:hypothetical protein
MKPFCIFAAAFLLAGICSVAAQDLIILRDGNVIEAKVTEIAPSEIRYKRYDHLDGPTIVIPAASVLSIRYENGMVEAINTAPVKGAVNTAPAARRESAQTESFGTTAMDPDKFIFGINANPGGFVGWVFQNSGPSLNIELGKGHFNSEINLVFPYLGFGFLATFNGFWPSRIGGFYLGGGIGFGYSAFYGLSLPVGLNIGYKFVTRSGLYFRTGTFVGYDILWTWMPVYLKPDLAIGWTMR